MKDTEVRDSRPYGNYVRRRRRNLITGEKFTTYEISEEDFKKLAAIKDLFGKLQ